MVTKSRTFPRPSTAPLRSTPMHAPGANFIASATPVATAPVTLPKPRVDAPWGERLQRAISATFARWAVPLLRISLGLVFFWFGALKLIPGVSPAEELAGRTISQLTHGMLQSQFGLPLLGLCEFAVGLGLLTGKSKRLTLLLLFALLLGTILPLLYFPAETFAREPLVPTLQGQYVIKNLVLICAAMVLGATARSGRTSASNRD